MRRIVSFAIAGIVAATTVIVVVQPAVGQVPQHRVTLTGAREVPGPGDSNARGQFTWSLDGQKLCYLLSSKNIRKAQAAHIHRGNRTVAGPVVVPLTAPTPASAACLTVTPALARGLRDHPARFYVNVHNVPFPAGALRAQLG